MNYHNPKTATPNTSVYLGDFSFLLHFWHFRVSENIIWLAQSKWKLWNQRFWGFDFVNAYFFNNNGQTQPGPSYDKTPVKY